MDWKKIVIFIITLIILLIIIWVKLLNCPTKCKLLGFEVPTCREKEKCFGAYIGKSRDCYPEGCCCYMLEK